MNRRAFLSAACFAPLIFVIGPALKPSVPLPLPVKFRIESPAIR